jgi:hypothetical protein
MNLQQIIIETNTQGTTVLGSSASAYARPLSSSAADYGAELGKPIPEEYLLCSKCGFIRYKEE